MRPEPGVIIDWIETRTRSLRLLAADLVESRQAFVQLDLDAIYRHSLQQQALCQEIQRLDTRMTGFVNPSASMPVGRELRLDDIAKGWDAQSREHLRSLLGEHEVARNQVCEISRVQADLLRRSRRYLQVLSNLVSSSMGYYQAPGHQSAYPGAMRGI